MDGFSVAQQSWVMNVADFISAAQVKERHYDLGFPSLAFSSPTLPISYWGLRKA